MIFLEESIVHTLVYSKYKIQVLIYQDLAKSRSYISKSHYNSNSKEVSVSIGLSNSISTSVSVGFQMQNSRRYGIMDMQVV